MRLKANIACVTVAYENKFIVVVIDRAGAQSLTTDYSEYWKVQHTLILWGVETPSYIAVSLTLVAEPKPSGLPHDVWT